MAKRKDDPSNRSSHDDPVVVDNGPIRVDFGQGHAPTADTSGKKWTRECTELHRLVVTEVRPFSEPETNTFLLDPARPVTLHLEGTMGGSAKKSTMVFERDGDKISVKSKDFKHALDRQTKPRYLRSDAAERPVVSKITMRLSGASQDTDFAPSGTAGARALIITFVPKPEAK